MTNPCRSASARAAARSHDDEGDLRSQICAPGRSAGGEERAHPVFQPSTGNAHRFQCPLNSERFSPVERPSHRECTCWTLVLRTDAATGVETDELKAPAC